MKRLIILLSLVMLFILPLVLAEQTNAPTQQYNKIFLNPFYRLSMTNNNNYTYNVTINPPDGISLVSSAIVSFQVYITPTVTFSIWINNTACNTPNYTVSTTYASSGQGMMTFDCSNAITGAGFYNITIRPSSANTGASTAWLDLTYMNNPGGGLQLEGTEYSPGDPATMFVQLKDSYGNAITNGSCYLDIWYPLNASNLHPHIIQQTPMIKAIGDNGAYYYDMIAPSQLGVYMLSAECAYSFNQIWIYPPEEMIYYPTEQIVSGSWQGNSSVLNSRTDVLYERCDGTIASPCSANYTFNTSAYGIITNLTNINVYFSGQTDTIGRVLTIAYWNGSTFVNLTNTLTFSGTGGTAPTAYDEFLTNSIPTSAIINNTIKLKLLTPGSTRYFQNWLSIALLSSSGTIQDVKGSSEMHITNIPSASANHTWTYNGSIIPNVKDQLTNNTWSYNGTISGNIVTQLNNLTLMGPLVASYIWNSTNRSLTYTDNIGSAIWSYNGTITPNIIQTVINNTWAYTGTVSNNLITQIGSGIATQVWTYNGNSTTYMIQTIVNSSWGYTGGRYTHGVILS